MSYTGNSVNNTNSTLADRMAAAKISSKVPRAASHAMSTPSGGLGSYLDAAGSKGSAVTERDSCRGGITDNGDECWRTLGHDVIAKIMEFSTEVTSLYRASTPKVKGSGSKRPKQAKRSENPLDHIPPEILSRWNGLYDNIRSQN